ATCVSPSMYEHHNGVFFVCKCVVSTAKEVEVEAIFALWDYLITLAEQFYWNLHALIRVLETFANSCPLVWSNRL
ncbi:hypothetical protein PMAYCL1PPCAC_31332, partial [Pristionchus mayeri]